MEAVRSTDFSLPQVVYAGLGNLKIEPRTEPPLSGLLDAVRSSNFSLPWAFFRGPSRLSPYSKQFH